MHNAQCRMQSVFKEKRRDLNAEKNLRAIQLQMNFDFARTSLNLNKISNDHDLLYIPWNFFSLSFLSFHFCSPSLFLCCAGLHADLAYMAFFPVFFLFRLGVYTQVANCTLALVVEFASR